MAVQDAAVTTASWLDSDNVNIEVEDDKNITWIAGKNKQTNKRHGISVPFVWSEETMWILIDLQNLVAVIMEHKMVVLQGDLQWQQACYVACNALGLSCWSCTCAVPFRQTKAHCMSHGCCWSGRKGGCKCKNLRKRTPCLHSNVELTNF